MEFPKLRPNRLILRKISVEDIPSLVKYANNRKISDQVLNIPFPYSEPNAVHRISYVVQGFKKRNRYIFTISPKETLEFIGEISLHLEQSNKRAELGYWLGEPFWGKGFTTEAARRVLQFAFDSLDIDSVYATNHINNITSAKVLTNVGMKLVNTNGHVNLFNIHRPAAN